VTHNDLVKIAEKWLVRSVGCGAVIAELKSVGFEIPDSIGWKNGASILVECKLSRADFLADAKKPFRCEPDRGMGNFRFYMCREGMVNPDELPAKWGLIWVNGKGKARQVVGPRGNIWNHQKEYFFAEKNIEAEQSLLVSALRRCQGR